MTNFVPQSQRNNNRTWNNMEIALRNIVAGGNELYILSGGSGSIGTIPQTCTPPGRCINIPAQVWKVVIVLPSGVNDVSRVNASTRAIAVITPNNQSVLDDWTQYRVSVDEVEELTGFDFFSNVPLEIQNVIESRVDGVTPASTIKFASATASVNEGAANQVGSSVASLNVTRAGNLATAASVRCHRHPSPRLRHRLRRDKLRGGRNEQNR